MNKIKIILVCLLIPFLLLMGNTLWKIKNKVDFQQKVLLAQETRKVLDHLMFDLREAQQSSILDAPADGMWHSRIAFIQNQLGALEYIIKEGHLFRVNQGKTLLIADNIASLRMRRQKETPDILEVQIEAQKNVSLISNLKIRMRP